ncbi:DUF1553 domain-containing protein [Anatilimnocola sp. NA78]|uniref:DUF1553 domain-containing protein n=1 Tax=Anatilimnocola sp. NA78 TaxID=3415683 RepID=UPI003CE52858
MALRFNLTILLLCVPLGMSVAAAAEGPSYQQPSYQRHVSAIFGKLGCNGGTCHGAVKGQNGFALSMFSADPEGDHLRLTRELSGRRLNFLDPAASLLLQKGTGQIPHGGGARIRKDSLDYQLLLAWISGGAIADEPARSQLTRLEVSPAEHLAQAKERYRLTVRATFANGDIEDVTSFCSFESLDRTVATVDATGMVLTQGVGNASLVVRYRAQPATAQVLVPRVSAEGFHAVAAHNFIDEHVLAKLQRLNLPAAEACDDATFLRRVYLNVVGQLPPAAEVGAFLRDPSPDKRTALIDKLLSDSSHADLWTLRFLDLLKAADFGVYADAMSQDHDAPRMQAWVRARLLENTPYDEFAERILLATSREGRSMEEYAAEVKSLFEGYAPGRPDLELYAKRRTLDLYWQRRGSDGVKGTLQVAHAFLGIRLECAQCHRHPHDQWQQEDLLDFANLFMRVRTVGFQGDNEKKFADAAVFFKQFNDQGKALEAEVKQRKEGEGKRLEEDGKKAKSEVDRLNVEIKKLEKENGEAAVVAEKRNELAAAKERVTQAEDYRQETAAIEKRAKLFPEIARRLLQAESRVLPTGGNAKVTSTLGTRESKTARLLGESEPLSLSPDRDPREYVVEWLRRPDNPYFSKAMVNRVWAHYFGRGIIDPPDNLSEFNPPTHPELLKELSDGFIREKYNLRWLHRTILTSRTYQQASTPAAGAEADKTHYAYFPLRRLPAEVLLDALNSATGTTEMMDMKYQHWPDNLTTVQAPYLPRNTFVASVLETYGRPQRNAAVQCDCERDSAPSIFQVLTLANHPRVWEKIKDPKGRVAAVLASQGNNEQKIEALFLATLSRLPTAEERIACGQFITAAESPAAGLQNVLWSLINTREFLVQH